MSDIENRVTKLEKTLYGLKGASGVLIVVILAFFGIAHFYQIPDAVDKFIEAQIGNENQTAAEVMRDLLSHTHQELYIESGSIHISKDKHPELRKTAVDVGDRGAIQKRIKFKKPFHKSPEVMVALAYIDHVAPGNLRIKAIVTEIDKDGFYYTLATWGKTDIWRAHLSWLAYGYVKP